MELFDLHYGNLVGFVYGYVRDEEVAKDIVHDTFLTFWNNRKRLDFILFCKILFVYVGPELCVELVRWSVMLVWKRNWLSCRINNGRFS